MIAAGAVVDQNVTQGQGWWSGRRSVSPAKLREFALLSMPREAP
jgi:hypothetical protein